MSCELNIFQFTKQTLSVYFIIQIQLQLLVTSVAKICNQDQFPTSSLAVVVETLWNTGSDNYVSSYQNN